MEMYFKRMKDEWTGLVEQADPLIRAWVWRWAICCMAQCSPKPFLPGPEWVHG